MKFNLNHDPNNKTLAIPRAALQLSGLAGVSDLILHTDSGCILLLPGDPTVAELLKTISLISTVAPQLISRLAERSQMAMETGMTETARGIERVLLLGSWFKLNFMLFSSSVDVLGYGPASAPIRPEARRRGLAGGSCRDADRSW